MVLRISGLIVALLLLSLWGYEHFFRSLSPSEVYIQAIDAAQAGDEDEFLSHFTADSRKRIRGLLATARNQAQTEVSPYRHLTAFKIESEEIEGDHAILAFHINHEHVAGINLHRSDKIFLRKEEGDWKIDILQRDSISEQDKENDN